MSTLANIIHYFRDCYQLDNRELTLFNFFSTKVEHRVFTAGEESLITGFLPFIPIDPAKAEAIHKTLQLYSKEKDLYYCSFFILGKTRGIQGKEEKICAPLFLYPASIKKEDDDLFYLAIDIPRRIVNVPLLNLLRENPGGTDDFYEKIQDKLPSNAIDFVESRQIARMLAKYFPALDTEALINFPELTSEKDIKQLQQESQQEGEEKFRIVSASAAGVLRKSTDTLGVLNELSFMTTSVQYSAPLMSLFTQPYALGIKKERPGRVPAILSPAQQKVISSANTYTQTLVIGPPGTGKSFTIAALAIEYVSKGKSVLIASKTNQAVDVIGDKIENSLGINDIIVRGGRKDYLRFLKEYLQNLLSSIHKPVEKNNIDSNYLEKSLRQLDSSIKQLEKQLTQQVKSEQQWCEYIANHQHSRGFIHYVKKRYIQWKLRKHIPFHLLSLRLEEKLRERNRLTIALVQAKAAKQINTVLKYKRRELQLLLQALRARTGSKQERLFNEIDFGVILHTLPVWLVNLPDIYDILPLQRELFDIAIIDEATQCDIASCLPVLYRAKKVVFAGDPKQLRHVSFLSESKQRLLLKKYELPEKDWELYNYRSKSILDVVSESITTAEQVIFLDEHYRSVPAIIDFSNGAFYNHALQVMTQKYVSANSNPIQLINCNGKRDKRGSNTEEALRIVTDVLSIIEQNNAETGATVSIGILSPFRDQVDYIASLITEKLTASQLEKHKLIVGTAYNFQGEERDIMFLSFALDATSHPSAMIHVNKPDVFNVAITRARLKQFIYLSADIQKLKVESLLRRYIESLSFTKEQKLSRQANSPFIEEVYEILTGKGYAVNRGFKLGNGIISLVVYYKNELIGIDLIGFPGELSKDLSPERYKLFMRA